MRAAVVVLLAASVAGVAAEPAESPSFLVVVSPDNPIKAITRQELARVFLKKTSRWSDGKPVTPVDQTARAAVRTAFTKRVLASEGLEHLSAVENFWLQQVYSGRGTPPPIKSSDADVLAFVLANPGAVGYVSGGVAPGAARVLAIKD